ncbi:SPOR domain-containing protein [Robiginitalea marina]|uniref:SPOR domain-containing protein n=1 Tax=Robiginitalea marina TaxID=2954105 RepID=A0ABT1AUG6_9FLAO|nr:SPOR domain-containing protein [Robiginitalea marina]MCO5723676.1 SPOR domain-containing protein [Robiginitalea marina]
MPFIEESDLLELHKDIDKAQIINERLLDQIKVKNRELKRSRIQRNLFAAITVLFLIGALAITSFTIGLTSNPNQAQTLPNMAWVSDSLDMVNKRLATLRKQNEELSLVKEFYLAKEFIEKEKIYSVQVKAFIDKNFNLAPQALTNTILVKNNPFYAYSLGNFETLEEARKFREELVNMGFTDAFVASYQDGKRIAIEDPN